MRKLTLLIRKNALLLFSLVALSSYAQVKIGNNPTIIDYSAVLELESTNINCNIPSIASSVTTDVATIYLPEFNLLI